MGSRLFAFRSWWSSLSHAYRNAVVLIVFDIAFLAGFLFGIPVFAAGWEAVTGFLPNLYLGIAMLVLSGIRSFSPGALVLGGVALDTVTLFLSLLSMHVIVGFGLGFLFDHVKASKVWMFVNYFTLIMVLFTIHFFLIIAAFL